MSNDDSVGTLLANIATSLNDALRIFTLADKRQWGPDEYDQFRALQDALDEAKKDFQEMGPLVNGQFYYENDRRSQSLDELRTLRSRFDRHTEIFKDWVRTGGPINSSWVRETSQLRRELHRAQRRVARRIFNTEQESGTRCLGAFLVYRQQRQNEREREREQEWIRARRQYEELSRRRQHEDWGQQGKQQSYQLETRGSSFPQKSNDDDRGTLSRRGSLESLVPTCNSVGSFQRFGDTDIAFVCDFCDGFIVWHDVRTVPATRTPLPHGDTQPNWQATAKSVSHQEEGEGDEDRTIVFAPLAIANHAPPRRGEWLARTSCPYCDQYTYIDAGEDGSGERKYAPDEDGFPSLQAFQEHLEWYHTSLSVPSLPSSASNCLIM